MPSKGAKSKNMKAQWDSQLKVEMDTGHEVSSRLVSAAKLESHKEAHDDEIDEMDEMDCLTEDAEQDFLNVPRREQ